MGVPRGTLRSCRWMAWRCPARGNQTKDRGSVYEVGMIGACDTSLVCHSRNRGSLFICLCDWVAPQGRGWAVLKHCRGGGVCLRGCSLSGARQALRPCGRLEHPGLGGPGL